MNNLREQITATIATENIADVGFVRLNQWRWVMDKLAETFLQRGRSDLDNVWLWERFKQPCTSFRPDDPLETLRLLLEPEVNYWLVASEENGKYWVLDASGKALIRLISEMSHFEYYIVNKEFSWLLCETHHGEVIGRGFIEKKVHALMA